MKRYFRKKHMQFREYREIMLPKLLKCVLSLLIGIMIGEILATPFFSTKTIKITNAVAVVEASAPVVTEVSASAKVEQSGEQSPTASEIEKKVCKLWGDECKIAIAVMKAESQGDPTRIGDKHLTFEQNGRIYGASYGLFQLRDLPGRFENPNEMLDEDKNIQYAYKMYQKSNWQPWSAWKNKTYLRYL
jgi:hypothetical protein